MVNADPIKPAAPVTSIFMGSSWVVLRRNLALQRRIFLVLFPNYTSDYENQTLFTPEAFSVP